MSGILFFIFASCHLLIHSSASFNFITLKDLFKNGADALSKKGLEKKTVFIFVCFCFVLFCFCFVLFCFVFLFFFLEGLNLCFVLFVCFCFCVCFVLFCLFFVCLFVCFFFFCFVLFCFCFCFFSRRSKSQVVRNIRFCLSFTSM